MNQNRGFSGLFNQEAKTNQAKDDLVVAEKLSNFIDSKRKEEQQAEKEIAAMQEDIRKQTDVLLGYDKKAIRDKAKASFNLIKNQIAAYGGNRSAFMANGGTAIINDYRNSVLDSDEYSNYQENQKNLNRILELEAKGLGYLINPVDRANMDSYRDNKGGKITFTGQLSNIEMPDTNNYDWNTEVPAQEILKYKQNRLIIMDNYRKSFPSLKFPPLESDLIAYVKENYYQRGSNYQKAAQEKQFNENVRQFDLNFGENQRQFNENMAWTKEQATAKTTAQMMEDQIKMYNEMNGGGSNGTSGTSKDGYTAVSFNGESYISNLAAYNEVLNRNGGFTTTDLDKPGFSKNFLTEMNKRAPEYQAKPIKASDFKSYGGDFQGRFWSGDLSGPVVKGLSGTYVPKNGIKLNGLNNQKIVEQLFPGFEYKNGKVLGLETSNIDGLLGGDGRSIKENKGWIYNKRVGNNKRDFSVHGIIMAPKGVDKDGNEFMLMDKYGTWGAKDKSWNYSGRMKNSKTHMTQYIALKDSDTGEIVYKEIPVNNVQFRASYMNGNPSDNIANAKQTHANKQQQLARVGETNNKKAIAFSNGVKSMMNDQESMSKVFKASAMLGVPNKPAKRSNLIMSFYATLAGAQGDATYFKDIASSNQFENMLNEDRFVNVKKLLKQDRVNDQEIIRQIIAADPSNQQIYQEWYKNYITIHNY